MSTPEATAVNPVSTRRERTGWYAYDWANSAFQSTVITVFLGPFLTAVARRAAGCESGATGCHVHPFGFSLAVESYFPSLISLSVLLTVVVLPVMGAIADRSAHKRRLLGVAAFIGAGATMAMGFVTGQRYLLGGALFLVANIAFGASIVVYNSFLPQLAAPNDRDRVSSRGWALGYLGGGLLLVVNLVVVQTFGNDDPQRTLDLARWSIVSAGVWWAVFTLVPLAWLTERPGGQAEQAGPRANVVVDGFRQLAHTVRGMRAYPLTLFFLLAFLVYNDGIQAVISLASQYGSEELKLGQGTLVATVLLVQFLAFGGALLLGALATRIGARRTVLLSLVLWVAIIATAIWLPVGKALPFMAVGAAIGLVLGGSQALSRSLFSQMIPEGKEGEYYGFYEISDKGTSWLAPLMFAIVVPLTGSYRVGLVSLLVFFVVGGVLLARVPVRRAIIAAGNTPPAVL